jgi:hypothetical protein
VSIVSTYWSHETVEMAERQQLVAYLRGRLQGEAPTVYGIATRTIPARDVLSVSRHLHLDATPVCDLTIPLRPQRTIEHISAA